MVVCVCCDGRVCVAVSAHSYVSLAPGTERRMDFHSRACPDGLLRRVESPGQMEETFDHRDDLLYSRHVFYARSPEGGSEEPGGRPLEVLTSRRKLPYSTSASHSNPGKAKITGPHKAISTCLPFTVFVGRSSELPTAFNGDLLQGWMCY